MIALTLILAFVPPCDYCKGLNSPWWPDATATWNSPDINRDCVVDISDQMALMAKWGSTNGACSDADMNYDGDVGTPDLLYLLSYWEKRAIE